MSMLKMVPEGLKARECERIKLRKPPPVPYVPVKDEVQDEVARMQSMEIKPTLEKDTTLNFAVWQENGTREAFLMHVTAVLDAIKKRGHLDDYEKTAGQYHGDRQGWYIATARKREKSKQGKEKDQGRREGGSLKGSSEGSRTRVSCQGTGNCSCCKRRHEG